MFFCPACGNEYCEKHRLHSVHAPGTGRPAGEPTPTATPSAAPAPKVPVSQYGIALILAALIIIGGVIVIAGKLSHGGTGTAAAPAVTACWTQGTVRTTMTTVPAPSAAATPQQYVTAVITVPSPDGSRADVTTAAATTTTVPATVSAASAATISGIRPPTGTIVAGTKLSGGRGEITIDNAGGSSDVVAILTSGYSKKTLIAVYIRQGDSWSADEIADGVYDLYVHAGKYWDSGTKRFTGNADYWKFSDPVTFTTSERTVGSVRYLQPTHWTLVIYPSIAGNAESVPVSEENFPDLP